MKISIITLGCKTNEQESREIGSKLFAMNYDVTFNIEPADFYILNTCSVTENADAKSRQLIARVLKSNSSAKILICGCASAKNVEFFKKHASVAEVVDVKNKLQVVSYFEKLQRKAAAMGQSPVRKLIKIQDGCNEFCTYCIIPYLRGRSVSRNVDEIVSEILSASEKEINITGINLYLFDSNLELLEKIKNTDKRIRLGSLDVRIITEEFLIALKKLKNFCPHFHLSMQSGSSSTLKRMNRKYSAKEFLEKVSLIRKHFENPFIACDVIAGFPEESEEEFSETLKTVKEANFAYMHVFPYSIRGGTAAEKMKQVPHQIKKKRAKTLGEINEANFKKYKESLIGKFDEILIEEEKDGFFIGHSKNYIKCFLKGNFEIGGIYKMKFAKLFKDGMEADVFNI